MSRLIHTPNNVRASAGNARFAQLDPERRLAMLEPPRGRLSLVIDTDTDNEIDDQFALVYALLSDTLDVEAIYAAPFHNSRSTGPGDGMWKSLAEIGRVLDRLGRDGDGWVFGGSERYLTHGQPVPSAAAEDLVARAMRERRLPLYVVALGAITNVASALLIEPALAGRMVVVWLGGEPWYWRGPMTRAFNLWQDVPAARVVFDSGVPLVHIPCTNVAEHLRTTLPEVERFVRGRGPAGDYLHKIYRACRADHFAASRVIWDVCNIAFLVNPGWVPSELRPSPLLCDDLTWAEPDAARHLVREAIEVDRDAVFGDLFRKLAAYAEASGTQ